MIPGLLAEAQPLINETVINNQRYRWSEMICRTEKKYLPSRQSAQVENLVKTCHDIVN